MSAVTPSPFATIDRDSPWPGLATFTEEQASLFHGRDAEIRDLTKRAERNALTVLFGQSGLGKSSLLLAGVFPRLRTSGYWPVYIRLDHSTGTPSPIEQVKKMVQVETTRAGVWTRPGSARPGESLWEFFHHRDDRLVARGTGVPPVGLPKASDDPTGKMPVPRSDGRTLIPVLVFDQFEELFTLGAGAGGGAERARAVAFMSELAELVENRPSEKLVARLEDSSAEMDAFDFGRTDYRVVITLREDFLPHLESLRKIMPALMENRMRLARMTGTQALDAVVKPGGALVTEEVARAIVEFVAGAKGGSIERLAELDVEPPLLSVICRELNERRRALGQTQITADLVSGNRREILHDFYERSVADLPAPMRTFVEDHLLTKSGFRDNLALETALEFPGVTPPLIDTLVSRRLLRTEDRMGVQRVELTHDVLAEVIRAARDTRQQRLALEQARERERRSQRKHRTIIGGLAAAVVALLIGAFFGIRAQRRAEQAVRSKAAESSRTDFIFGSRLLEDGKTPEGLGYLVRAARSNPDNPLVGPRLLSALAFRSFAEPVGRPLSHPGHFAFAQYLGRNHVICWSRDGVRRIVEFESGRVLTEIGEDRRTGWESASPDGRLLPVCNGSTVTVWDLRAGKALTGPLDHEKRVAGAQFSPDSRWLLTGDADGKARVWNAATGVLMATLEGRSAAFGRLAVSADSRRVVTVGEGGRVWSIPEGEPMSPVWPEVPGGAWVEFSPDGTLIVTVRDAGAQLHDARTLAPIGPRLVIGGQSAFAFFSPDGKVLLTKSTESIARLWAVPAGKLIFELEHGVDVRSGMFSPDGRHIVTTGGDGVVRIWSVQTGRLALEPIRAGDIRNADVNPAGDEILTSSRDGIVRRWQFQPNAAQPLLMPPEPNRLALQRNRDGAPHAITIYPDRLQKIDLLSGAHIGTPTVLPARVTSATVSPDEGLLAVRTEEGAAEVWDVSGAQIQRRVIAGLILGNPQGAGGFRFSADSAYLTHANTALRIWETKSGAQVREALPELRASAARTENPFSSRSRFLSAYSNEESGVRLVEVSSGKRGPLMPHTGQFAAIGFSPDESRVATVVRSEGGFRIWDTASGNPVGEILPHRNLERGAIFSVDGRRLLTWTRSETNLWNLATGTLLTEPMRGGSDLEHARFSPSEDRVAVFAGNGDIRIYDAASGAQLGERLPGSVRSPTGAVGFTADGRFVMTATAGGGLAVWPVPAMSKEATPEWLLRLATMVAAGEIDSNGNLQERIFDAAAFDQIRAELAALPKDAPYAEWGRWLVADRAKRSIAPGFTLTRAEAEKLATSMAPPPAVPATAPRQ